MNTTTLKTRQLSFEDIKPKKINKIHKNIKCFRKPTINSKRNNAKNRCKRYERGTT